MNLIPEYRFDSLSRLEDSINLILIATIPDLWSSSTVSRTPKARMPVQSHGVLCCTKESHVHAH
jgi:hypothetical protein